MKNRFFRRSSLPPLRHRVQRRLRRRLRHPPRCGVQEDSFHCSGNGGAVAAGRRQAGRQAAARRESPTNERTNERTGGSLLPQPHHRCPSGPSPALPSSPNRLPTKLFRRLWVLLQHWSLLSLSLFRFNYGGLAPRCCRLCFRIRSRGQSRCGYTRIL